ncbi:MAG: glycosyltransferase family 4 protein [Acidobacteria bacterium]|nr:glycosyltransferase family 4 protein [Acidobacteriota bacterium]
MGQMRLGIDASNIRDGGGLGHISEILRAAQPEKHGISKVIVWGGQVTLGRMPGRSWLECRHDPLLDQSLPVRIYWQMRKLPLLAAEFCDLLLAPGGIHAGRNKPFVVISQNMLPFEFAELRRYGFSSLALKYLLIRLAQINSFQHAQGAIFMTQYSRSLVKKAAKLEGNYPIIPYGISQDFRQLPREQKPLRDYSVAAPFKLLYVSKLEPYKHHRQVIEAIGQLRSEGLPVTLDLIGSPEKPDRLRDLQTTLNRVDAQGNFIHYRGHLSYQEVIAAYHQADGFVFASSCETLPNILLEAMAAGLPVASSSYGPMPEALGDAGLYFDPLQPESIACAVRSLVTDHVWRAQAAHLGYERAQAYTWERCADDTFSYLAEIASRTATANVHQPSELTKLNRLSGNAE